MPLGFSHAETLSETASYTLHSDYSFWALVGQLVNFLCFFASAGQTAAKNA